MEDIRGATEEHYMLDHQNQQTKNKCADTPEFVGRDEVSELFSNSHHAARK